MPFRAYCMIWNEWFRDQNNQDPCFIQLGDNTVAGTNGVVYQNDAQCGGMPLPVSKIHDYFTSALPGAQKGPGVSLPFSSELAPVNPNVRGNAMSFNPDQPGIAFTTDGSFTGDQGVGLQPQPSGVLANLGSFRGTTGFEAGGAGKVQFANMYADLSAITATTINDLRAAFQLQRLFEKDARGGTRYTEIIRSHFGVTSPDSRQQRPEYLGGNRIPINVNQVLQTSVTTDDSPLANTAAYSLTTHKGSGFTKSFTEHGYIMIVGCVRTEHTYQQGIERF